MLGGIIGDIVGSIYEFQNIKTKVFPFFDSRCDYTESTLKKTLTCYILTY